jgi:predicted transcriptional regulator
MNNKKTSFVSVRLPDDIKDKVKQRAEMSSRTIAGLILHYIKLGLVDDGELKNETFLRGSEQG